MAKVTKEEGGVVSTNAGCSSEITLAITSVKVPRGAVSGPLSWQGAGRIWAYSSCNVLYQGLQLWLQQPRRVCGKLPQGHGASSANSSRLMVTLGIRSCRKHLHVMSCACVLTQEYRSGLSCHPPGNFPTQGSNPHLSCLLH